MTLTVYPAYSTYINSNIVPTKWFYYLNINIVLLSAGFFLLIKNIQFKSLIINNIAKYSFGIYFIHLFFIMMLNKLPDFIEFLPYAINAILITAVVLLLSFAAIYLLKKIPLLSTYIDS